MAGLTPIDLPDAERQLSELVRRVEATGEGYVVLERGRPVARLMPAEERRPARLTPERQAALARLLSLTSEAGLERFDRAEIYDERADELDRRGARARRAVRPRQQCPRLPRREP